MENTENKTCYPKQHNHEITGSTSISGCCEYAHNHRFATVTGDAIPCEGSHVTFPEEYHAPELAGKEAVFHCHVHEVKFKTDSCNGHHHEFCGTTEKAVDIGCGKHIHLLKGCTSYDANHKHEFIVSTDMENPICK